MNNKTKSMRGYFTYHIKGQSSIYKAGEIIARGIIGVSKNHPASDVYLREQIADYHNKIITECKIIGMCWSGVGCDVYRVNEFYNLVDKLIQDATMVDCLEEVEQEIELFIKYISVVFYLMGKLEQDIQTKKKEAKLVTTTLSIEERAKKIERISQYLDSKVFTVGTKKAYPDLVEDVAICAVDECKTGKDIMALAVLLYDSKKITIIGKPNTMKGWVNQFKSVVECDKPTDNYKDRKDVEDKVKKHLKRFTYLQN